MNKATQINILRKRKFEHADFMDIQTLGAVLWQDI